MSTPSWANVARALPPEIVQAIWEEIHEQHGPALSPPDRLKKFVEVAIDHPHYANVKEIAQALGETSNRVTPVFYRVVDEARRARTKRSQK